METISLKDRNEGKNYFAFFDLDRTITNAISGKELAREAFRKGQMTYTDLFRAIYLSLLFRMNLIKPLKIIDNMVDWVAGIPEQSMTDLCSEVFHSTILPSVYGEARTEIKIHKEKNAKVVILSSSITPVCREAAKSLRMDDIICSDLEVINGYLTGRPVGRICFGEEKAIRLEEYCKKNNVIISDAWYYGDSFSDLPALIRVGNPVCVNPDRKLKKEAYKRGWEMVRWNH